MEQQLALHTAARRWLIDRSNAVFAQKSVDGDRYEMHFQLLVLEAIRHEVEAYIPEEYENLDQLFEMLNLIGHTAINQSFSSFLNAVAENKRARIESLIDNERQSFVQALDEYRRSDLHDVIPLPYCRTLFKAEASQLWNRLKDVWNFKNGCWYPICGPPRPDNTIAFLAEMFYENLMPHKLPGILTQHGIERVYELHEGGPAGLLSGRPEQEMAVALLDPRYGWLENYWCTKELDWLLYASHESSITIGGDWFVEAIKQAWSGWSEGLYEQFEIAHWHLGDYRPDG